MKSIHIQPRYLLIAVILFIIEVIIATQLESFGFIRGSVGDLLVVMLIYALIRGVTPVSPGRLAAGVFLFAGAVEFIQYLELPDRLGIARGSLLGIIVGNTFSWSDMLMYAIGCGLAYLADGWLRPRLGAER